jgi:hypothetical protein
MKSEIDLVNGERKTYLSYFDDGIIDIVAGLPVLSFGLGMLFDADLLFVFTWLPAILFWPLKHAITSPRMGYVKFRPERRRKISKNLVLLFIAGTISLLMGVVVFLGFESQAFDLRELMLKYGLLVLGALMAGAFVLVSILFEIRRFMGYAALVFIGWLLPFLFSIGEGITVALAGGAISLIGLGILVQFLVNTPLPSD